MNAVRRTTLRTLARTEGVLDRIKFGYKWRFDRWDALRITPYLGYGTKEAFFLKGRVLDDRAATHEADYDSRWHNVLNMLRRIATAEVPGARLRLRAAGATCETTTDDDGFFEARLTPGEPLAEDRVWHPVRFDLLAPERKDGRPVRAEGRVIVPPPDARFAVVSDLDDTVVRTGATHRLQMIRTVLLNNARTRTPFEGVGAFYRALQRGPDDRGHNPVFYVSSSPWNLYDLFVDFMSAHDIPVGPLFLKDYGLSKTSLLHEGHAGYKTARIEKLLRTYPDLPFVLIGDSGQEDPEIYRALVRDHPGRIRAVYIRDVTPPGRDEEVRALAREMEAEGTPTVLTPDTVEAAAHARETGLIAGEAVDAVRREQRREHAKEPEEGLLEQVLG